MKDVYNKGPSWKLFLNTFHTNYDYKEYNPLFHYTQLDYLKDFGNKYISRFNSEAVHSGQNEHILRQQFPGST